MLNPQQSSSAISSSVVTPAKRQRSPVDVDSNIPKVKKVQVVEDQEASGASITEFDSDMVEKLVMRPIKASLKTQKKLVLDTDTLRQIRWTTKRVIQAEHSKLRKLNSLVRDNKDAQPLELAMKQVRENIKELTRTGHVRLAERLLTIAKEQYEAHSGELIQDHRRESGLSPELTAWQEGLLDPSFAVLKEGPDKIAYLRAKPNEKK